MKTLILRVWKIIRSREFLVCVTVYPALIFLSLLLKNQLSSLTRDNANMYGSICFFSAALFVLLSLWEIIGRLLRHGRQGKHLEIRKRAGIEVPGRK